MEPDLAGRRPPELDQVDLVLDNCDILTSGDDHRTHRRSSIAIRDGVVVAIGGASGLKARQRLDLDGHVVLPGFVNLHTHAVLTMVRGVAEDLGTAPAYTPGVPHATDLRPDEARAFARLGVLEALLFGSTTVVDAYRFAEHVADAAFEFGCRAWVGEFIHDVDFDGIAHGRWDHRSSERDRTMNAASALIQSWSGRGDGRINITVSPHAPDTCSPSLLAEVGALSRATGAVTTIHLAQSKAEMARVRAVAGCSPTQLLEQSGLLSAQTVVAHGMYVDRQDAALLAAAGVTVAHVPKGNATGGRQAPTSMLADTGVRLGLATDNMHADMLEAMRWAVATGRLQDGGVCDRWQPVTALRMATSCGAAALGVENTFGTIGVGATADLVVVDARKVHLTPMREPLGSMVHVAQGRDVRYVLVDGEMVVADGRPTRVDMDTVIREADSASRSLWARVERGRT